MVLEFAIIEFISSIFKSCFWFLNLAFGIDVTVVCYFDCRFFSGTFICFVCFSFVEDNSFIQI